MPEKLNLAGGSQENAFMEAMKDAPAFGEHVSSTEKSDERVEADMNKWDELKDRLGIKFLSVEIANPNKQYEAQYDYNPMLQEMNMPIRQLISTDGRIENVKYYDGQYDEDSGEVEDVIAYEVKDATWVLETYAQQTGKYGTVFEYAYTIHTDNPEKARADLLDGAQKENSWENLSDIFGDELKDFPS